MKETTNEEISNNAKPPCQSKGFETYLKLVQEANKKNRAAYECLGRVCKQELIPSYKRRYYWVRLEDIEEACWDALREFIEKLDGSNTFNIGLLWRTANFRIIDFLRKSGDEKISLDAIGEIKEPERSFTADEINDHIGEFKDRLNNDEAKLFDLHYIGDRNIEGVRDLLGWTNGRISRLKETINEKAKKFGNEIRGID